MVDWDTRIRRESPLFQRVFQSVYAKRVLDAACGTGHHACQFARWGLEVCGSDISEERVKKSIHLAGTLNLPVDFRRTSFDELSKVFDRPFDAAVCTGNSLSAAGKRSIAAAGIAEMYKVIRPGGAVLLQVLNYDLFPPGESVYGEPIARERLGQNYIFLKAFRRAGTTCELDVVALEQGPTSAWTRTVFKDRLLVLDEVSLIEMVEKVGFSKLKLYGDYDTSPFDRKVSRDLILVARRE
jgi:SAM-dependent methyltransferase